MQDSTEKLALLLQGIFSAFLPARLSESFTSVCVASLILQPTQIKPKKPPSAGIAKLLLAHAGSHQRGMCSTAPWGSLAIDFPEAQDFSYPPPCCFKDTMLGAALAGKFLRQGTPCDCLSFSTSPFPHPGWPHQALQAQQFPALTLGGCARRGAVPLHWRPLSPIHAFPPQLSRLHLVIPLLTPLSFSLLIPSPAL